MRAPGRFVEWLTDEVERKVLEEFERISERGGVLGAMETGYQRSRIQEESLHYERLKHSGEHPIVGVNTFLDPQRSENVLEAKTLTRASKEEKDARLAHVRDFQARHAQGAGHRAQGAGETTARTDASPNLSLRGGAPAGRADEAISSAPAAVGAGLAPARDDAATRGSLARVRERDGVRAVLEERPDTIAPWQRPSADALVRLQHTARTGANLFAELLQTVCSCSLGQITHALYEVGGQYRRSM